MATYSQAAAAEMSMELVSLSADLASFKNISIDEANTALKSIFTGETESLKNLGVVMTEVNLESYAMAQGITTAYSEMDQAEKVALRYEYVLASTENAQGDFSRTSEGTANQLRILQESLKEAASSLGEELLPMVTPVITELSALVQTFADLDETTKENIVRTGLFLAALGPALKTTSGVTTAVNAGIAAYKALTVAQTASTAAQTGMNVAMNANPIGAVVTAVGALVAVLGALAVSTALTTEKTTDLTDSLQASREAYATTLTGIQEQDKSVQTMVDARTALEQVENKSTAQKQAMLLLVEDLNEAVPELSLAYDAQNDVLNMTADRIEALARAELERQQQTADIERLTVLYQEQAEIESAMAEATANQTAAYAAYNEKLNEAADVSDNYEAEMTAILQATYDADDAVEALTATQATNSGEIEALTSKYGEQVEAEEELITTTVELTEKTKTYAEKIEEATKLSEENTSATASLTDATTTLNGSLDSLSSALLEQQENGALSLETTLQLIDAGYANALTINSETGAVTVNKDTYLQLTKAKIADQQASINQQIASTNSALAAQQEALWYANLANAALAAAEAKAQMAESREQLASLEAQKASLIALQSSLDSYTGAVVNYGSTVSGTSNAITSQAEQDLQTFQTLQAQLEHQRTIEEISQEEYYVALASYRDDYLSDDSNLDEYRSITEEIYSYDKSLAEDEQELWENQTEELIDQLQSRMDEILSKQAEMQSKLSDYGDLFEIDEDNLSLSSLQDQISVIEQYGDAMESLKARGIAQGLLEEITALDVDEALAYSQALLGMTEENLEEYSALWEEKQLNELLFGIVQEFDKTSIVNATVVEGASTWCETLPTRELTFTFDNSDHKYNFFNPSGIYAYLQDGQEIQTAISIDGESTDTGAFFYTSATAKDSALTAEITANDCVYWLDKDTYDAGKSGTWTLETAILTVLGDGISAEIAEEAKSRLVGKCIPLETTKREALRLLAQAGRCACWCNRQGVVMVAPLEIGTSVDTLDADNMEAMDGASVLEKVDCVKITVNDDFGDTEEEYTSGEGTNTVSISNPCVVEGQDVADWLLSVRQRRLYFDCDSRGNPDVEVGDTITIYNAYEESALGAVETTRLYFDGGLTENTTTLGGAWA